MRIVVRVVWSNSRVGDGRVVRVNFLIGGTQKGGTSALDAYLRGHPEICMARVKEVHFFDNENLFRTADPDYDIYHEAFTPRPAHKAIGESTPIYMYWRAAAQRVWQYNPHMKLIVLLRNPIERAYSHWNMERARNRDDLSFWDAIVREAERCREALPLQHRIYSYVDRGFYSEQLRRLSHLFGRQRMLVLKSETLRSQPRQVLNQVCDFLDVPRFPTIAGSDVHAIPYERPMSAREREYLRATYEREILDLQPLLDWDCSDWLTG